MFKKNLYFFFHLFILLAYFSTEILVWGFFSLPIFRSSLSSSYGMNDDFSVQFLVVCWLYFVSFLFALFFVCGVVVAVLL